MLRAGRSAPRSRGSSPAGAEQGGRADYAPRGARLPAGGRGRMNLRGCEVAVIGAGIGGLAAALALARRGARVVVLEGAPALEEAGAGIQVGPNAVAVLEALGVRPAAEARASLPAAVELRDWRSGRLVARVPLGRRCVARYGRPYLQLHRADLVALLAAAAAEAGADLRLGEPVTAVEPLAAGARLATGAGEIGMDLGGGGGRGSLGGARGAP